MPADPGTPAATAAEGESRPRGTAWRIFRIVLIGIAVTAALLVAFPPWGLIKDQIAKSAGQSIGRTVTIGDMRVSLSPLLTAEFSDVRVSNPPGSPERDFFRSETVRTTVAFFPLFKGRVRMESLALIAPHLALEEDAAGTRNWIFAPEGAGAAPDAAALPVAEFSLPPETTVAGGTLSYYSAVSGVRQEAGQIDATLGLDAVAGGATAKGSLVAGGEAVAFDVALGDFDAVTAGGSTPLKATLDARLLRAAFEGDALFASDAEFTGDLTAGTPSLIDLARWLGADAEAGGEPLKSSLEGKVQATTRDIAFTDTDLMINTTASRFDGTLDLGGERPKLAGTFNSEHIDLDRILGTNRRTSFMPLERQASAEPEVVPGWDQLLEDLKALEAGPQAAPDARAETEAVAAAAAQGGWSEQPFNLKGIRAIDLDVTINAAEIGYGSLDLKRGKVKADIADGVLGAKIEELAVGAGTATGTLSLDARAEPPRGTLSLNLAKVAAEPIITEITGNPLLSGTSDVEITATAAGQNQSELTATLDGKARFHMGQGALRGFNVRRMIFEWWKSWSFDLAQRTNFDGLEAQYDIRKGVLQSRPGLSMGGPEVEISSTGSVNVPARSLNQQIRVKAIPPPTALPIPVRISGSWTKPSVGIDWWGLFSAAPGIGGPQALARATEAPPVEVEAAIRRVLAAGLPAERLAPAARQMLESLLPAEPAP